MIFTQKPLNYSENSNADMIKIMDLLQWQQLKIVGQQVEDKDAYERDLKVIYSSNAEQSVRIEAEQRIMKAVIAAGEPICHGDLLTEVRFESCKRLKRMCVSAVERFDFLRIFRLGTFHLRMNKTIQDICGCMRSEVNVDDVPSCGFFKTILGLHYISNDPEYIKKDGNYEAHAQFINDIGSELLIKAFKSYVELKGHPLDKNESTAMNYLLSFYSSLI